MQSLSYKNSDAKVTHKILNKTEISVGSLSSMYVPPVTFENRDVTPTYNITCNYITTITG